MNIEDSIRVYHAELERLFASKRVEKQRATTAYFGFGDPFRKMEINSEAVVLREQISRLREIMRDSGVKFDEKVSLDPPAPVKK